MTAKELLATYPSVSHAVAWMELIICQTNEDPDSVAQGSAWGMMMRAKMSPREVLKMVQEVADEDDMGDDGITKIIQVRQELRCPEFLTYLRGKMGYM